MENLIVFLVILGVSYFVWTKVTAPKAPKGDGFKNDQSEGTKKQK